MPQGRSNPIHILYQDEHIIVIDKPPGMLAHVHVMDRHSPNVQAVLEHRLSRRVFLVHRLDRMTGGVMVIALTGEAAASLALQFRNRQVTKRYLAIVRGHSDDDGRVTTPLAGESGEPVESETSYVTLGRGVIKERVGRYDEAWFSLVEINLHTGRRHQARRHLHQINHPVLGDNRHGDKEHNRWAVAAFGSRQLYLRAWQLEFTHPATGKPMSATAAVPEEWIRALDHLGIAIPVALEAPGSVRTRT